MQARETSQHVRLVEVGQHEEHWQQTTTVREREMQAFQKQNGKRSANRRTFEGLAMKRPLTRAPMGYFYNAPHWGGGGLFRAHPSDLRNYWADSKNSNGIWKTWKNCRGKTNFIDLGVTSDVTGQVKVKMFDISGLVTSASKIAMLSTNKAN